MTEQSLEHLVEPERDPSLDAARMARPSQPESLARVS